MRGVDNADVAAAIRQLGVTDPQSTEAIVQNLKHEPLLGLALHALAEAALAGLPKNSTR